MGGVRIHARGLEVARLLAAALVLVLAVLLGALALEAGARILDLTVALLGVLRESQT